MNTSKLQRRIRFLTLYVILSQLVLVAVVLAAFLLKGRTETLDELTVKRINIVDETGQALRMVISNESRQHPGILGGQEFPPRERPAGIIFFNTFGDECGGLVYDGHEQEAGLVLSVDQFGDDQIMQLQYMEDTQNKLRKYGLQLWDYPKDNMFHERMERFEAWEDITDSNTRLKLYNEMKADGLLMEDRLFLGKDFNKDVGLFIKDSEGNVRIKIYVNQDNTPVIALYDKYGNLMKN
ncbi:MAG: hypothetical protein GX281_00500 [Bacteroidales bacterium]|jgi:hypothetical protein|nr:hypothetical protein [Bacteroidales bacterium]NLK79193.1 hypothetical protein [Bacteroidales bacterium]HPX79832.1 hypothetical protein [Bacteroidales bacterium]